MAPPLPPSQYLGDAVRAVKAELPPEDWCSPVSYVGAPSWALRRLLRAVEELDAAKNEIERVRGERDEARALARM